jgi:flagellin-like hook-associated protein FlgL
VQSELRAVDGTLSEAVSALQRGLTLAAQGASETQDARGRELIAAEVEAILRHVTTLGNAVYDGRYVFGGSMASEPPFDTGLSGKVEYRGDVQSRTITFPDGRSAQVSLPGDAIFLTPDALAGSGRTAPPSGALPASPPIGIGVAFSGDLGGVLSVDLPGPFLAPAPPSGAAAGDVVAVRFQSVDGAVDETLTLPPLAGGESAAALAASLNAGIAANATLAGKVRFVDQGGALQFEVSDAAGAGFSITQTVSGSVTTGLEGGGVAGGYSAEEIAAALNAAVLEKPGLTAARVRFEARDGEVIVDSDVDLSLHVIDFDRGTGFSSGLAGVHRVGGADSANVFGVLEGLLAALRANDTEAIAQGALDLQGAVDHVSGAQAFYGATLRQAELTLATLTDLEVIHQDRLSAYRDADILESIANLQKSTSAEQFAIQVAARRQPNILDVLA